MTDADRTYLETLLPSAEELSDEADEIPDALSERP